MAYMLKYDTMHGQFNGTIEVDKEKNNLLLTAIRSVSLQRKMLLT
jgi:glyceraldehyde 3-phosphate dehydrogenase